MHPSSYSFSSAASRRQSGVSARIGRFNVGAVPPAAESEDLVPAPVRQSIPPPVRPPVPPPVRPPVPPPVRPSISSAQEKRRSTKVSVFSGMLSFFHPATRGDGAGFQTLHSESTSTVTQPSPPLSIISRYRIVPSDNKACQVDPMALYQAAKYDFGFPAIDDGDENVNLAEDAAEKEDEEAKEPLWKNPKKLVKILLPHAALLVLLLSYIAIGAFILQIMESENELELRRQQIHAIKALYERLINETWDLQNRQEMTKEQWEALINRYLHNISLAHDAEFAQLTPRWSFPTSVLYALTLLTACGYERVNPATSAGKIFSVAFALIGIPLMFITAADIGKFLSEMVITVFRKWHQFANFISKRFCNRLHEKLFAKKTPPPADDRSTSDGHSMITEDIEETEGLWFPIGAYVGLVSAYCALGAFLYRNWEPWGFIHAFQFSFNQVVTIGLGNVNIKDGIYLTLAVAYIIVGLAVVSLCVDLASTHLKAYFEKIHYFGRAHRRFIGMGEDIREMMQIIAAMRKKKGGKLTWNDIRRFVELENQLALRPFVPRGAHWWRFIDETSSAMSTVGCVTRASFQSDLQGSTASLSRPALRGSMVKFSNINYTGRI